jgi:hypothetical protein
MEIIDKTPNSEKLVKNIDTVYELLLSLSMSDTIEFLFQDCPGNPFSSLRRFQSLTLDVANQMQETIVCAPSQAGKSTISVAFNLPVLFKPNGLGMWVANSKDNAEQLMARFIAHILGDPKQAKELLKMGIQVIKSGIDIPELITIGSKQGLESITISATQAEFISKVASVGAVAGKSPDRLVLDEVAKWQKKATDNIFSECQARTGDSKGQILIISTIEDDGEIETLPNGDMHVNGNLFTAYLEHYKHIQRTQPHIPVAALDFTYHANPNLKETVPTKIMSTEKKKKHYWGFPMSSDALPLFDMFNPDVHVIDPIPPHQIEHHNLDKWVFSIDPGNITAIALVQKQSHYKEPRVIIHKTWEKTKKENYVEFLRECWVETTLILQQHLHKLDVVADIAANQKKHEADQTSEQKIRHVTNRTVHMHRISKESSTEHFMSFMEYPNCFKVTKDCPHLIKALKRAKPVLDEFGEPTGIYEKDGKLDHIIDTCRYSVYHATHGLTPYKPTSNVKLTRIRRAY